MLWFSRQLLLMAVRYHQAASLNLNLRKEVNQLSCGAVRGDISSYLSIHTQVYTHIIPLVSSLTLSCNPELGSVLHNSAKTVPHQHTHAPYWFVLLKVSNALCYSSVLPCVFNCVCLYVCEVWENKKQEHVWDTNGTEGPSEGYPDAPEFSRAAPSMEEQLWPLLVTPWISHTVNIDFSHWLCQESEVI